MKTGDTIPRIIALSQANGTPVQYANLAAAVSAGWSFVLDDATGTPISSPSMTLVPKSSTDGSHYLFYVLPAGLTNLRIVAPSGYRGSVLALLGEGESYSLTDLANLILSLTAQASIQTTVTGPGKADWSWVQHDSINRSFTIPATTLAEFGWTDLSGATFTGAVRAPGDNGSASPTLSLTGTQITGSGLVLTIAMDWDAALNLSQSDYANGSKVWNYDIQMVKSSKKKTILSGKVTILRDEDNA